MRRRYTRKGASMTEDERNLDLLVGELERENKLMRARNERLERTLEEIQSERDKLRSAVERILAVSNVALWNGRPQGTGEVGTPKHTQECND
jgi:predicted RNase H-like nuclease (RuvC/YqgF family)